LLLDDAAAAAASKRAQKEQKAVMRRHDLDYCRGVAAASVGERQHKKSRRASTTTTNTSRNDQPDATLYMQHDIMRWNNGMVQQYIATIDPFDRVNGYYTTQRQLVQRLYRVLQWRTGEPASRDNNNDDDVEKMDMGQFEHPLNPTAPGCEYRFDFDASTLGLETELDPAVCDRHSYYFLTENDGSPGTGELVFPNPYAVWQINDIGQLRVTEFMKYRTPWCSRWLEDFLEHLRRQNRSSSQPTAMEVVRSPPRPLSLVNPMARIANLGGSLVEMRRRLGGLAEALVPDSFMERFNSLTIVEQCARQVVQMDVMGVLASEARTKRATFDSLVPRSDARWPTLIELFRQERLQRFVAHFCTTSSGLTDPIIAMIKYVEKRRQEGFGAMRLRYSPYSNLTVFGSFMADFMMQAQQCARLSNSHSLFAMLMLNIAPNAYSEDQLIPLHLVVVGAPGVGKSTLFERARLFRLSDMTRAAQHETAKSRYTSGVRNDTTDNQDEGGARLLMNPDSAKGDEACTITLLKTCVVRART
jgi:hypothetical protein